jgi:diguanylate cyclase (GGDEF)-like protein
MNLDVNTLFFVTIYVEAILGLLLLFAWIQNPGIRAVAWWGGAHLVRALSVVLFGMSGFARGAFAADVSYTLLFVAYALIWTGARVFDGRKPLPILITIGPVAWLVLGHLPQLADSADLLTVLSSGIIAAYTWLTAFEFWRGRGEPLVSRWPAIFMLIAHGMLFMLRTPVAALLPWSPLSEVVDSVWLTVMSFEALLFTIAIAFILLAMAKERTEYRHKTAALIDPLTGIANRRAFLSDAAEMLKKLGSRPVAVLLIDLDHFKSINDRFGHAVGDRVLQVFAETTVRVMRRADLLGRLGGEEFAAVLCNLSSEKAMALAEHIRCTFAAAALRVDGHAVGATLSIGMVLHQGEAAEVPELLAQADHELYYAKERGRNRIEVANFDRARERREPISPPLVLSKTSA